MSDDLAASLRAIVERLVRLGIPYMIVGSIAALAHGRKRATQDFNVVIEVDRTSLAALLGELPATEFYVSPDAAYDALARSTMFNVIDMATGWKVDLIPLKRRAFSRRELARRVSLEVLGLTVAVASIEDVILAKLEWSKLGGSSARQLEDVRELLALGRERVDAAYVEAGVLELGLEVEWAKVGRPDGEGER